MHGGRAGGPFGSKNGAYKHGRFTRETRELVKHFRELVHDAHVMTATVMNRYSLRPPRAIRRRRHVKKAIEALKKVKEEEKA
jgi:hypothetical protein